MHSRLGLSRPAPLVAPVPLRAPCARPTLRASRTSSVRTFAVATSELPSSLKNLVESFQAVPEPMARYKQLLFYATKLEKLPASDHTPDNKVTGCVSQVWVVPDLRKDGRIYWRADSDSQLTKGLAALLVQGLSGCSPEEIVRIPPDFITLLGLQQALTPSRNNGFLNMFKLMQKKSLELLLAQQKAAGGNGASAAAAPSSSGNGSGSSGGNNGAGEEASGSGGDGVLDGPVSGGPVEASMRHKLAGALSPLRLSIRNESDRHAGHAGHVGSAAGSGETHFSIDLVSKEFEGLSTLKRHRLVYSILAEELKHPVHALSLVTKTPAEAGLQ